MQLSTAIGGHDLEIFGGTVDVVYTWKYGDPHILNSICANEMKPHVYNIYVLQG